MCVYENTPQTLMQDLHAMEWVSLHEALFGFTRSIPHPSRKPVPPTQGFMPLEPFPSLTPKPRAPNPKFWTLCQPVTQKIRP